MTKEEVLAYIYEKYGVAPEYPFKKAPEYAVFRNPETKKRFCLSMPLPRGKVQAGEEGTIDVINLKSESGMIEYLLQQPGIREAYHMNKTHWISVLLGKVSPQQQLVKSLIDISYKYSCKNWRELLGLKK